MNKLLVLPAAVAALAGSTLALGAATADAAPCPKPTVTVRAAVSPIVPGTALTYVGKGFACGKAGVELFPQSYLTSTGQTANAHGVTTDSTGGWIYETERTTPGTYTIRVDGPSGVAYKNTAAFTVVANPATASTSNGVVDAPTAVPAGHVDVVRSTSDQSDEGTIALAAVGAAFVGAGIAARRRSARRVNG